MRKIGFALASFLLPALVLGGPPIGSPAGLGRAALAAVGDPLIVIGDGVNVRYRPAVDAGVKMRVYHDQLVTELGREGDWVRAELVGSGGEIGWIHTSLLAPPTPDQLAQARARAAVPPTAELPTAKPAPPAAAPQPPPPEPAQAQAVEPAPAAGPPSPPAASTVEPSTAEPGTPAPSIAEPGTPEPAIAAPAPAGPSTTEPGTPEPPVAAPVTARPSTTEPGMPEPSIAEPATTEPSTTEPGTPEPSMAAPATPSAAEPATTEPSTAEPSTAEPSMAEPSMAEPGTAAPSIKAPSDVASAAIEPAAGPAGAAEAADLARFRESVDYLNSRAASVAGVDLFGEVKAAGDGVVQVAATDAWSTIPPGGQQSYANTLLDRWAAARGYRGPVSVQIVDPEGQVLLESKKP